MEILETSRGLAIDLVVKLPKGLHSRPSAALAKTARSLQSNILLIGENGEVDAKSMLDILSLGAGPGARLRLLAKGPDSRKALEKLAAFLTGGDAGGQGNS